MHWRGMRKRLQLAAESYLIWTGKNMSLAFKLAVPVLVSTSILVAVMASIVVNEIQSQVAAAFDQEAEQAASGVTAIFLLQPTDAAEVNDYLARLVANRQDIVSIRILGIDPNASVIASSNPSEVGSGRFADASEKRAILGGYVLDDEDDGGYRVTVYPLKDDHGVLFGAVMITSSKAKEAAAEQAIVKTIVFVGITAVAIDSVFVLSALYLGILRRTRRVVRAIESVADGDTSTRLVEGSEEKGRDEIFNLARSVGRMIETLDDRKRGDGLIRHLTQRALTGADMSALLAEALAATKSSLGLEGCTYVSVREDGSIGGWVDAAGSSHAAGSLPVWLFALARVAVEARRPVMTDRLGQHATLAEGASLNVRTQALVVPLPRTSRAGQAIIAIAQPGETIPDGGLVVLESVAATISESVHMQAAEVARAESAVKSRVMAAVSHEMRNPLNSILGFTGLVLGPENTNLSEKQRRQLGYVQTSATNMLNLVNNYLDLAKLRSGTVSIQYETVKLEPLVAEVAALMQPIAARRNVSVRVAVAAAAEARIDPTRVRQILTNLLSNAIKFTPEGGHVYVRARVDTDTWRLVVSDSGVGIPKEQAKLVFSEFAKIDAGSEAAGKGTGLGLPLTKAFVAALGGSIKFYSRQGRGTTFAVTLPRNGDESGKRAA